MAYTNQQQEEQKAILPDSGRIDKRKKLIFQVDEGHNSKETEYKYRNNFRHFKDYVRIHDLDVLLDLGKEAIQELVIKYAKSMRDDPVKKYKRGTVHNRIASVIYFFENNDIELNKRKIRRYYPPDESVNDDRPYSTEEIQRMLSVCGDLRTKAMILLMASAGVRIGALSSMQIVDLTEVSFQSLKLYKIQVYARTRDKYTVFTTPEAAKAIDEYLDYRTRCKEEIKDKSPLFRKYFNKHDPFTINVPKFLSTKSVEKSIDECLKRAGVKTNQAMRSHAFRKGFKSICEQSGMKSINVETLMGHDIGVSGHYYRPAESDMLEDYMTHAADALTIDPTQRLKKQIQQLQTKHSEEWNQLKAQMNELKRMLEQQPFDS